MSLTVVQLLPALDVGGVERGTLEIAAALVAEGHRALVVSAGGKMVSELEALGATHFECPIGVKRLSTLRTIRTLRELIVEHGADIVHARSRLPAWIGHRALAGLPPRNRPRWVTTVHGPYTVNAYSRIMTSGETVIAISEFIRDYVIENYPTVDSRTIRVIPRGIDRERYPLDYRPSREWRERWRQQYPETQGKRLLVLPGRLTRWKGQEHFIDVIAELCARQRPVHGLIAGGAPASRRAFERELHALAHARGVADHLTFLGARDDLRDVLAHADVAYSLTLEPEAFGRTTVEALSLGTPVIGYDHGGTGEILRRVFPQGLVPVKDIPSVVATTGALLDAASAVPAEHPYTLARMQSATLDAYAALGRTQRSRRA